MTQGRASSTLAAQEHVSLVEVLDRVLNKGAVVVGDLIVSVADVDLLYLSLRLMLSSVETARKAGAPITRNRRPTKRKAA